MLFDFLSLSLIPNLATGLIMIQCLADRPTSCNHYRSSKPRSKQRNMII